MKLLLSLVVVVIALGGAPARADQRPRANVIALLPLAAEKRLEIYGQPVASELARSLEQRGFSIVVVTSTAPVPSRAHLVIDGRIVRGADDAVKIEARVRDPLVGKVVAELSASVATLTRIDEAVGALSRDLVPVLEKGLTEQRAQRAQRAAATTEEPGTPATSTPVDRRPLALVSLRSAVKLGPDDPALEPLLAAGAVRLAGLVGYRAEELRGPDDAATALPARGAALAVQVDLLDIDYEDRKVVTARARARVRVVDRAGEIWDRVVRTDTVVGGRGDRRDAVARAAIDQIVDIAMPRIRERLAEEPAE